MPAVLRFLFYLAALVCFGLAALAIPVRRLNLVALGLAFVALVHVVDAFDQLD